MVVEDKIIGIIKICGANINLYKSDTETVIKELKQNINGLIEQSISSQALDFPDNTELTILFTELRQALQVAINKAECIESFIESMGDDTNVQ